jgi:K(+)-stimulated pyrophosphate-energized sodium pump
MNLVSLLIVSAIVKLSVGEDANTPLRIIIALVAFAGIAAAVFISKRRSAVIGDDAPGQAAPPPPPPPAQAAPPSDPAPTQQFEAPQH